MPSPPLTRKGASPSPPAWPQTPGTPRAGLNGGQLELLGGLQPCKEPSELSNLQLRVHSWALIVITDNSDSAMGMGGGIEELRKGFCCAGGRQQELVPGAMLNPGCCSTRKEAARSAEQGCTEGFKTISLQTSSCTRC